MGFRSSQQSKKEMNRNRRGGGGGMGGGQRGPVNLGVGLLGAGPGMGGPGALGGAMRGGSFGMGDQMGQSHQMGGGLGGMMGMQMKQQGMLNEMGFSGGDCGHMNQGRGMGEQGMMGMNPQLMKMNAMQGGGMRGAMNSQTMRESQLHMVNNLLKQQQGPPSMNQSMMGGQGPGRGQGLLGNAPSFRNMMGQGRVGQLGRGSPGKLPSLLDGLPQKSLLKRPGSFGHNQNRDNKRSRSGFSDNRRRDNDRRDSGFDRDGRRSGSESRDSSASSSRRNRSDHSPDRHNNRHERTTSESSKDNKKTEVTLSISADEPEAYDPAEPTGDWDNDTDQKVKEEDFEPSESVKGDVEMLDAKVEVKEEINEDEEGEEARNRGEMGITVTVGKKGRSVSDPDRGKDGDEDRNRSSQMYNCHACNVKCYNEQSFARHMNGMKHQKRMEEMMGIHQQTQSQMLARLKAESHLRKIEAGSRENHCRICDKKFVGSFQDHRQTQEHKTRDSQRSRGCRLCGISSFPNFRELSDHLHSEKHRKKAIMAEWPHCSLCNQSFKSPRKYVAHCKTPHHISAYTEKQRQNRDGNEAEEDMMPDMGELVTLDEVGFEEEGKDVTETEEKPADQVVEEMEVKEEQKEDQKPVKEDKKASPASSPQKAPPPASNSAPPAPSVEQPAVQSSENFDDEGAVGQSSIMQVSGYFCKLCHKFYNNERTAKVSHCKSASHIEKYKKAMLAKAVGKHLQEKEKEEKTKSEANSTVSSKETDSQSQLSAENTSQSGTSIESNGQSGDLKTDTAEEEAESRIKDVKDEPVCEEESNSQSTQVEASQDDAMETEESGEAGVDAPPGRGRGRGTPRGKGRRGRRGKK